MKSEHDVEFPPFRLDISSEQLWRGKDLLPLRPKTFAVLRYLVEHPGRLVTRDELCKAIWPDTYGAEKAPKQCVLELRAVLGDSPTAPQFIETLGRRGYRWVATGAAPDSRSKLELPSVPFPRAHFPIPIFVGRASALAQLHQCCAKALHGERQIVFITGEPGIGKTTLVQAFLAQVVTTAGVVIAHGQCVEHYGAGEAYLPVLEAFGRLGRSPGRQRLIDLLRRYAPTWLVQLPALIEETELDDLLRKTQGATTHRMLRELAEVVEVGIAETPLILVLEDIHWSDSATLALVAMLATRPEPARLLVMATYRPADVSGGEHSLRALVQELQSRGACCPIALTGLDQEAVEAYLQQRFPQSALPSRFASVLHQRTEGNPLFLTNVIADLIDHNKLVNDQGEWVLQDEVGAINRTVPGSIRSLMQKQIERQSPDYQRLLEAASVAGATFAAAAIAPALDVSVEGVEERCETLAQQQQFFRRAGQVEWPDGTRTSRYAFQHAVYQTVLQERIVPHRLQRLHQQVGERLETAYGARAGEIAGELAAHFEAGRDIQRAVSYRQSAAENALQKSAHQEAIAHASAGLALVETLPLSSQRLRQELYLRLALGPALIATQGYVSATVEGTYTRALALCEQLADDPRHFSGLYGLWAYSLVRDELQRARNIGEQLLSRATNRQAAELVIEAHWALGCTLFWLGELTAARTHLEESLALYKLEEHSSLTLTYGQDPAVSSLCYLALTLWQLGYPEHALQKGRDAMSLAHTLASPYNTAIVLGLTAMLYQLRREVLATREQAAAVCTLSREHVFPFWEAVGIIMDGWSCSLAEHAPEQDGADQVTQGITAYHATGSRVGQTWHLALAAEVYGKAGRLEEGLQLLERALDHLRMTGGGTYEAEVYRLKGELLLAREVKKQKAKGKSQKAETLSPQFQNLEPTVEAERCFQKALEIAQGQHAKAWELRAGISLARLWQRQGKSEEAYTLVAETYAWFTEGRETHDLREAAALLLVLSSTGQGREQQRKESALRRLQ